MIRPLATLSARWRALYRAGVRSDELARVLDRELTAARSSLREILGAGSFEEGDLVGLHEGLLSADPSGQEARFGNLAAAGAET